ncbi:MAG: hypothetical protein WAW23_10855 [Candidatus Methanoperedens sp.]
MVGWESIPVIYRVYSYFKKYLDLNEREKSLVAKEEQLKNRDQEIARLRNISEENSKNLISMIDFDPNYTNDIYIQAGDNNPSPHLEMKFSITNRSLFDLKVKKIHIRIYLDSVGEVGEINEFNEMNLPHQQIVSDRLKLQLHPNFINILKSLKKEGKKNLLRFNLSDVQIDFEGDRKFRKPWQYNFSLELPIDKVYVS